MDGRDEMTTRKPGKAPVLTTLTKKYASASLSIDEIAHDQTLDQTALVVAKRARAQQSGATALPQGSLRTVQL